MEKVLLEQLNQWHNDDEFKKIVERIMEIPEPNWDYDLVCHLARAMNNLDRYGEALQLLLSIEQQGEQDALWHFRLGYSYYYLEQYENAVKAFEGALQLDPTDESASMFLKWSRQEIGRKNRKQKQAVQAESEQGNDNANGDLAEKIKPFLWVEHDSGNVSVILNVGSYKDDLFQIRADEGFEGNGYDWGSLAAVFLEERMPQLTDIIRFDPESSMFCAYSGNGEALRSFAVAFKEACEDNAVIRDLFSRAELD